MTQQREPVAAPTVGNEHRIFGPPGTGKTTTLSASIKATAQRRGSDSVMVASFTAAAAKEIASRDLAVPRRNVGTLHSFAYRAIDTPEVAEEHLIEWNKEFPALALSIKPGQRQNMEESPAEWTGATDGDVLMAECETLRAKMIPHEVWPTRVQHFYKRFTDWKLAHGVVDFTDMIEIALDTTERAPTNPQVGFFDEAQDFTKLEMALVRKWGSHMERLILAGDDDQMLYAFKGAQVDAMLEPPLPPEQIRVLDQSYRVPRAVHQLAQFWVERLSRREPKNYLPRDEEGGARLAPFRFADPTPLVRDVVTQIEAGRSVMLLASCGYMIDPVKHELKAQGVPFHNPYRRTRGDWNPLKPSRGVSSVERLLSYLIVDERTFGSDSREWTGDDVRRWAAALKVSEVMRRGAKAAISQLPEGTLEYDTIFDLFSLEQQHHLADCVEPDLDWFARHLLAGSRQGLEYPIQVARKRGAATLLEEPKVVIGTMHSVKGGQADVVYVCPELSRRGYAEWAVKGEPRDSVIRLFYVALTRAREEVVVCNQNSQISVDPVLLMAGAHQRKKSAA